MSMQCLQVGIVVFGSRDPQFFNYDIDDGFGGIRHLYIILDHVTFACLIICTIYEPVFIKKCENIICRIFPCFFKKRETKVPND
jgi:hypothetical protein